MRVRGKRERGAADVRTDTRSNIYMDTVELITACVYGARVARGSSDGVRAFRKPRLKTRSASFNADDTDKEQKS